MITTINEFKNINESIKEYNYELMVFLDSPYKWGKGWTASHELYDQMSEISWNIIEKLDCEKVINSWDVPEGINNINNYRLYLHPQTFSIRFNNIVDLDKIKNAILDESKNQDIYSIDEIKLKDNKTSKYTVISEGSWALPDNKEKYDMGIEILKQLKKIKKDAYTIFGDDEFYNGLDIAEMRGEYLLNLQKKNNLNENKYIDNIISKLDELNVRYELSNSKHKPFKAIFKPVNKSDDFYKKLDDIIYLNKLEDVVKIENN